MIIALFSLIRIYKITTFFTASISSARKWEKRIKKLALILSIVIVVGLTTLGSAALIDRGGELIYNDDD